MVEFLCFPRESPQTSGFLPGLEVSMGLGGFLKPTGGAFAAGG